MKARETPGACLGKRFGIEMQLPQCEIKQSVSTSSPPESLCFHTLLFNYSLHIFTAAVKLYAAYAAALILNVTDVDLHLNGGKIDKIRKTSWLRNAAILE